MFQRQKSSRERLLQVGLPCLIAVVLVAAAGSLWWLSLPQPNAKAYQAVFLANGQVYFGKLRGIHSRSPVLDDVFYLQVNQPLQQGSETGQYATGTPASGQPQVSVIKLGQSEIHGPEDRLFLTKTQILFWENLRADSQVIRTIQEFRATENRK
jgi:hypothetical protein